jgi:hypothetical protein
MFDMCLEREREGGREGGREREREIEKERERERERVGFIDLCFKCFLILVWPCVCQILLLLRWAGFESSCFWGACCCQGHVATCEDVMHAGRPEQTNRRGSMGSTASVALSLARHISSTLR